LNHLFVYIDGNVSPQAKGTGDDVFGLGGPGLLLGDEAKLQLLINEGVILGQLLNRSFPYPVDSTIAHTCQYGCAFLKKKGNKGSTHFMVFIGFLCGLEDGPVCDPSAAQEPIRGWGQGVIVWTHKGLGFSFEGLLIVMLKLSSLLLLTIPTSVFPS